MGYHYKADFTIRVTESSTVSMALDTDRLNTDINSNSRPWANPSDSLDVSRTISDLMDELSFEVVEQWSDDVLDINGNSTQVTVYSGFVSTKLNTNVDIILTWMASHGVNIEMDCHGEDDALWAYRSDLNGSILVNETIAKVPHSELTRLRSAESTVNRLLALAGEQNTSQKALLAALEEHVGQQVVPGSR